MTLALASLYLLLLLGIGFYSLRQSRGARDYFLAGGRLGLLSLTFATMASIMSGFVFVGGPGLFYQVGLSSFWIVISGSFTGAMMCWVLARPLFVMARRHGCLTLPEVILKRYRCRLSSGLAALGILLGVVGYLATQLKALGVVAAAMLNIDPTVGLVVALGVLGFYSVAGGMLASVYTDVVQGVIMVWVATLVFYFALSTSGGLEQLSASLLRGDPSAFHPWGVVGAFGALSWFLVFAVGSLGQPHVVHKFMMVRDLRVLRFFPLALAGSMLLCSLIWLGSGLAVKGMVVGNLIPPLGDPDNAIIVFLKEGAPKWLAALAYVGIVAAIMSTADTFVNVGAAALTRDLPRALGFRVRKNLLRGRVWSALLFASALFFTLGADAMVAYLGIFAFGSFAAALTPAIAVGLNWEKAGPWAARSSILFGILCSSGLEVMDRLGYYALKASPAAVALTLSLLMFVFAGSVCDRGWNRSSRFTYHPSGR